MDTFDFEDEPKPTRNSSGILWNVLTGLVLIGVLCVVGFFLTIFINPYSSINPFPPSTLPVALAFPTPTETPVVVLPPTWTPAPTLEPTATDTPRPTATLPPTPTFFSLVTPSQIPETPTVTKPAGGYPFVLKNGGPIAIPNIAYPNKGCDWMGVGGQVFDMSGGPKTQLIVVLGGTLAGKSVHPSGSLTSLTGVAPQYGQAGYEFVLGDKPVASKDTLWIQLVDQAGLPLSDKVYFDTYSECDKNLILINFTQVK